MIWDQLNQAQIKDLLSLIESGQNIAAVKLLKENSGADLKTCKDVVEKIADGSIQVTVKEVTTSWETNEDLPQRENEALLNAMVRNLVQEGKQIEAVKLVKEEKNLTLSESKDWVERIAHEGTASVALNGLALTQEEYTALIQEAQQLVAAGEKNAAVRLVKEHFSADISLADSQKLAAEILAGVAEQPAESENGRPARRSWFGVVLAGLVLLLAALLVLKFFIL